MLEKWLHQILQEIVSSGVREFCLCPGKRNAPLIQALEQYPELKEHYWYEERSAAFFSLGRARETGFPVAVVTTSGTAAAELLPAAMEAKYSATPLLLITADRPRRFRGSGAPQSVDQVGLYGNYVSYKQDIEKGEPPDLKAWDKRSPAHLNVCFEEPQSKLNSELAPLDLSLPYQKIPLNVSKDSLLEFEQFLEKVQVPLVIVSTLSKETRRAVLDFLLKLNAPVYLEATSGLREHPKLQGLRIQNLQSIWDEPIDGILRIGGIPTCRLWRDLEDMQGKINVCSISDVPFSGLSWGSIIYTSLKDFFYKISLKSYRDLNSDQIDFDDLFLRYPKSEPSLMHQLSKLIPHDARVYLGNSLPIREWDLAASKTATSDVWASRGVNGIDGQLSTFLGLCNPEKENWALVGDLTALYDLSAPWILSSLKEMNVKIVVINNGGGMIFSRLNMGERFYHRHGLDFSHFAKMWGLGYEKWVSSVSTKVKGRQTLIEIIPDEYETKQFWKEHRNICTSRLPGKT